MCYHPVCNVLPATNLSKVNFEHSLQHIFYYVAAMETFIFFSLHPVCLNRLRNGFFSKPPYRSSFLKSFVSMQSRLRERNRESWAQLFKCSKLDFPYDRRRSQIAESSAIVCDHMETHFCDRAIVITMSRFFFFFFFFFFDGQNSNLGWYLIAG